MEKRPSLHAVLTGDIVNSTKLNPGTEKRLIKEIESILEAYQYEFYRGDSFQVYMSKPSSSLRLALLCRTLAIGIRAEEDAGSPLSDVRISIGIGPAPSPVKGLGTAKGKAFLLSGRSFDELQQSERRLVLITEQPLADIALQVIADHIDIIYKEMTAKQAIVIHGLLQGETQQSVALRLNKSKSTVSQLADAGRWPAIERLLQQYELLIHRMI